MSRRIVVALVLASAWTWGCGDDGSETDAPADTGDVSDVSDTASETPEDVPEDVPADVVEDVPTDVPEDVPADVVEDVPEDAPADVDEDVPTEVVEDVPEDVPAETDVAAVCGNGTPEGDEVCDDDNTDNEACDTTDVSACLGDCSLLMDACGDGEEDPGEACDDGDADDYDDCTTSCTDNTHNIGAPCRCTSGCSQLDMSAGTIVGCENVEPVEGSGAEVACTRSIRNTTYGITIYSPGGACTLMAMGCTGNPTICGAAPSVGNTATFACPEGYVLMSDTRDVEFMGMTAEITTMVCLEPCETNADCRWNEVEDEGSPWAGDCGQWECIAGPDGARVCGDVRM